ncbi:hypothetical protein HQ529_00695 [Candidatus Woesearchaeota archaeon]|nr:hypothetical protein [Candidatus Woesearchaeota archaeon]
MVVNRRISREKYILAAIFTVLIFSLGLAMGIILDYERLRWIEQITKTYDVDFRGLQFQVLYLNSLEKDNASCDVLYATLESAIADLGDSLETIQEYEKQSKGKQNDFDIITRRYLLDNLRYWLLVRETKDLCGFDAVEILYFHSLDDCDTCPNQGVVLSYFKKKLGDKLLVFPVNVDIGEDEPSIGMIKRKYDVKKLPTLIIEDKKYEGVIERNELNKVICQGFKTKPEVCA